MRKTIKLKPGETAKLFQRGFSSLPIALSFQATTDDGSPPQGEIEIRGSTWIVPKSPVTQALEAENTVNAGFWDTFFSVSVTAHCNLEITPPTRRLR